MIEIDKFEEKLKSKDADNDTQAPSEKAQDQPKKHTGRALSDAEIAVKCLDYLAPWRADDYQGGAWLDTGMALHSAGVPCDVWDHWSQQSDKYKPGECAKRWKSFGKRDGRKVTIASLIDWAAKDAGLTRAELMQRINPSHKSKSNDGKSSHVSAKTHMPPTIIPWRPFPTDILPEPIRSFVKQVARATGCDESFVALPILAGLASAIGNTCRIQLKRGWSEPAIVWTAIVGDSGTLKSPPLEIALRPIRKRQHEAMRLYESERERYENESMRWEKTRDQWKRKNDNNDPPQRPEEPTPERYWCDDTTMEALGVLLKQNPRGLLLIRDELSGWLGGFDRYNQGKGGDVAKWLEMHGGRSIVVDRKSGNSRTLYIPQAAVSVTGGIQPATLARALGTAYRENGLAARLLFACPPRRPKRWTEADISPEIEQSVAMVFDRLFSLTPDVDDSGEPQATFYPLSEDGKTAWIEFYNAHAQEQAELSGDLSAVWSKLEGYAARFALVIHLVSQASGDFHIDTRDPIGADSVLAGVALSRWFGNEARRVYAFLSETGEERDNRRLVELIQRKEGSVGSVSVRDWQRMRSHPTADVARTELDNLVKSGLGQWKNQSPGPQGGRPSDVFQLSVEHSDNTDN